MWLREHPCDDHFDDPPKGDGDAVDPFRCPHDGQPLQRRAGGRRSAAVYRCRACGYEYRRQVMAKDAVFGHGPRRMR